MQFVMQCFLFAFFPFYGALWPLEAVETAQKYKIIYIFFLNEG